MIETAIQQFSIPPDKAETLRIAHEIDLRSDATTGSLSYANGATDTNSWLRGFAAARPGILPTPEGAHTLAPAAPVTHRDWKTASLTELSAGIKTGSTEAQDEFTRRIHTNSRTPGLPHRSGENLTALMIAAKAGDPIAIEKLKKVY